MSSKIKEIIRNNSWIWAVLGSLVLWLIIGIASKNLNFESLIVNIYVVMFLAIAALGQMLVITLGRGAIDLSIPGVITISAFLSMGIINGKNSLFIIGLIVAVCIGAFIGFLNGIAVIHLKIPPIIATMAMGYILLTASLLYSRLFFSVFEVCPILLIIIRNRIFGIPLMIFFVMILAVVIHIVINNTSYGKSLIAIGQNIDAARFAGVKIVKVEMITYIISGVLAGITGMLLAARVNGAIVGMGDSYLLETVGSVIIGGTLISGGKAVTVGTLTGCLFLGLIITAMLMLGFNLGLQNIAKGLLIIILLAIGTPWVSRPKYKKNA